MKKLPLFVKPPQLTLKHGIPSSRCVDPARQKHDRVKDLRWLSGDALRYL